jgi:hypothetical protein
MTRAITIAALVVIIGLGGVAWRASSQRDAAIADVRRLRVELATATAAIDAAKVAAEVHRVYADRLAREAREMAKLLSELETMDGQDAPLSPLLDDVGRRLWQ